MYVTKYLLHRSVKLIALWLLTHHICDKTERDLHLVMTKEACRRSFLALNVHLCDPVSTSFLLVSTNWDHGKGETKLYYQALFFLPVSFLFSILSLRLIVVICNYKYNWRMRRTYILVVKLSLMPWKDRRLAFFIFVRIMYLKEKWRNIDYDRSPHFHRFGVVVPYVSTLQRKVFA